MKRNYAIAYLYGLVSDFARNDPEQAVTLGEVVAEYIGESEHNEGSEYWLRFSSRRDLALEIVGYIDISGEFLAEDGRPDLAKRYASAHYHLRKHLELPAAAPRGDRRGQFD